MATDRKESSDETVLAWKVLEDAINDRKYVQEMMTLEILSCNSFGGSNFTNAFVTTQEKLSTFIKLSPSGEKACGLYFQHIWDIPKLSTLIQEKQREDEDNIPSTKRPKLLSDEEKKAYACLQSYLNDMNLHQKRLEKVLGGATTFSESDVVRVVDAHLFGPLSEGNCYIDNHTETDSQSVCSCGCGRQLRTGPTGLGIEFTWHGYADMFVQGTVPVTVWLGQEESDPDSWILGSEEQQHDLENNTQSGEMKKDKDAFQSQLIAQTITNAFAQVNQNEHLAGLPIPAFGCTPTKLIFYGYDCENDVLLKKKFEVDFVQKQSFAKAVVLVWLHLNFTIFMREDVTSIEEHPELKNFQAKFCINDTIRSWYKNVEVGANFTGFQHSSRNETHVELITTREIKVD